MCGIKPPFQGSGLFAQPTQGVALGYDRPHRWRSRLPANIGNRLSQRDEVAPMDSRRCFDSSAPKGQAIAAQGNALGHGSRKTRALKGRPNLCGASSPSGNRLRPFEEVVA